MGNPFLNEEQFKAWSTSSDTRKAKQFMRDWRENLKEAWSEGRDVGTHGQAMAQVLGDLIDLEWERDVIPVYEEPEKETDDGEETAEG